MERKQKETQNKYGKNQKTTLSKEEQKKCDEFKKYRLNCQMSQKQWAEKIGLSYGLVKRIEAHTIACSAKTMSKVQQFLASYKLCPAPPDLHNLEELILFDVFLTKMQQIPRPDAAAYAEKCTQSLRKILSQATRCNSEDEQKRYFEFIDMFLKLFISIDFMELAKQTVDVSDIMDNPAIMNNLAILVNKRISKFATPPLTNTGSMQLKENTQLSLYDLKINNQ